MLVKLNFDKIIKFFKLENEGYDLIENIKNFINKDEDEFILYLKNLEIIEDRDNKKEKIQLNSNKKINKNYVEIGIKFLNNKSKKLKEYNHNIIQILNFLDKKEIIEEKVIIENEFNIQLENKFFIQENYHIDNKLNFMNNKIVDDNNINYLNYNNILKEENFKDYLNLHNYENVNINNNLIKNNDNFYKENKVKAILRFREKYKKKIQNEKKEDYKK